MATNTTWQSQLQAAIDNGKLDDFDKRYWGEPVTVVYKGFHCIAAGNTQTGAFYIDQRPIWNALIDNAPSHEKHLIITGIQYAGNMDMEYTETTNPRFYHAMCVDTDIHIFRDTKQDHKTVERAMRISDNILLFCIILSILLLFSPVPTGIVAIVVSGAFITAIITMWWYSRIISQISRMAYLIKY
jgi:hypothetical protein